MDDFSQSSSKISEDDQLRSHPNENDDISKLKMEIFHLRLRCYNLEEELVNCRCSNNQNETQKNYFDNRLELNNVVHSHQELKWANERLEEENRLLSDKCSVITDDLERKLSSYESLKMKFDQLSLIVDRDKSVPAAVAHMMKNNEEVIKTNVERKLEIMSLKKKLAEKNNSFIEDESLRRKSLTKSLAHMFKANNESSFQNNSALTTLCPHCDELKVYTDKLSETMIKMTIDFQGLNNSLEQKNVQMANLERELISIKSLPKIDEELLKKYKVIAKQCMRKYLQEKESIAERDNKYSELIEFYMKQQGELQLELDTLKTLTKNSNSSFVEETNKIGELFVQKLSEVEEANVKMCSLVKIINIAQESMNEHNELQLGRSQSKMLMNSSLMSDADSVYFDKNISLNATMFKSKIGDNSFSESNINEVIANMQRKVQELGAVVQSYIVKIKEEHSLQSGSKKDISCLMASNNVFNENTSVWTNERTENNESVSSIRDEFYLKRIYEEEKERFENLLEEKALRINELMQDIKSFQQRKAESDSSYNDTINNMSMQYTNAVSKYHQKIRQLKDEMEVVKDSKQKQDEEVLKLETKCKELNDEIERNRKDFNDYVMELEYELEKLRNNYSNAQASMLVGNQNLQTKQNEMDKIFNKLKYITEEPSLQFPLGCTDKGADSVDINYIWKMLELVETSLRDKSNTVETASKSVNTSDWNTESEIMDLEQKSCKLRDTENMFYKSSLSIRKGDSDSNISLRSGLRLNDLTNITELSKDHLPDIPKFEVEGVTDKFKYIRDNPEKIHLKMKYFYETCQKLKSVALNEHEENKALKKHYSASLCQVIDEMTTKIDDFKRQLDLCRECLVRSEGSLPDAVTKELKELNLL